MNEIGPVKYIVLFSDGIVGHINQSRGIALWISRLTGAEILEVEVPILAGATRARAKNASRKLAVCTRRDAREYLSAFGGDSILRRVGQWFSERNIREGSNALLTISAGSSAAAYNLAMAHVWRCACATVMTPSVIGTEPFDYAIVPEHDFPDRKPNVFVTLGSPNSIVRENLEKEADALLSKCPPESDTIWSLLIGGDDANYSISPEWVMKNAGYIIRMAEQRKIALYITTSRRTSLIAEKKIKALAMRSETVKGLFIASEDPFNPIPAMLGFSDEVFCTDDSINMVSETITGGHKVVLLRADRNKGIKSFLQNTTASLVTAGALPPACLFGPPKFDVVFDQFARHNVLIEFKSWLRMRFKAQASSSSEENTEDSCDFNEAKRAASWIVENWHR